jgi:hypothetical protein
MVRNGELLLITWKAIPKEIARGYNIWRGWYREMQGCIGCGLEIKDLVSRLVYSVTPKGPHAAIAFIIK